MQDLHVASACLPAAFPPTSSALLALVIPDFLTSGLAFRPQIPYPIILLSIQGRQKPHLPFHHHPSQLKWSQSNAPSSGTVIFF